MVKASLVVSTRSSARGLGGLMDDCLMFSNNHVLRRWGEPMKGKIQYIILYMVSARLDSTKLYDGLV